MLHTVSEDPETKAMFFTQLGELFSEKAKKIIRNKNKKIAFCRCAGNAFRNAAEKTEDMKEKITLFLTAADQFSEAREKTANFQEKSILSEKAAEIYIEAARNENDNERKLILLTEANSLLAQAAKTKTNNTERKKLNQQIAMICINSAQNIKTEKDIFVFYPKFNALAAKQYTLLAEEETNASQKSKMYEKAEELYTEAKKDAEARKCSLQAKFYAGT